jgi:hypothetical protein
MTKGPASAPPSPTTEPARRSHIPGDGTAHAAAVEAARRAMLDDARPREADADRRRRRLRALLLQGVDVIFSYPGGVILPLYDVPRRLPGAAHVLVPSRAGAGPMRPTATPGSPAGSGSASARPDRARRSVTGSAPPSTDLPSRWSRSPRQRPSALISKGRVPGDRHQRHHPADDQKRNYLVRDANDLPRVLAEVPIARTGRRPRPRRHHEGRAPAGDDRSASDPRRGRRRASRASGRTSTRTAAS